MVVCQNLSMAQLFQRFFKWVSKGLGDLKSWLNAQFMKASVPEATALCIMCVTAMAAFQFWGNPLLVVLFIVAGNACTQMCIDYFPSSIKPRFSALSRMIPVVASVLAYLLSIKA